MANIKDAIASSVDIPSGIARYQQMLHYASTPLDYVCGIGPSDMALHPGYFQGYDNLIKIVGSDVVVRHNPEINEVEPINPASEVDAFQMSTAPPAGTVHKEPQPSPEMISDDTSAADVPEERQSDGQATAHEEEKTAIMAAGIAVGLEALWLSSR